MHWRVIAYEDMNNDTTIVRIIGHGNDGSKIYLAKPFEYTQHQAGVSLPPASSENIAVEGPNAITFLQSAMDAAWRLGLRPSNAQDEKHLQAHLKDMRDIVRHTLKMNKT